MALPDLLLSAWPPDPIAQPHYYRGVTARRVFAYLLDAVIIGLIVIGVHAVLALATVASFGLLWPLHLLFVPVAVAVAYHTLLIGGPFSATFGMRAFALKVHGILGNRPSFAQAFVQTVCFYATAGFSGGILLLVALFNAERRTLHDFLAGTIVLRNVD